MALFLFDLTTSVCVVLDRNHVLQVYHTSGSLESMGVNGEALQLHAVHKNTMSRTRIRISTASHARICNGYYK